MRKQAWKSCSLGLREIEAAFPSEQMACGECAFCPLLKADEKIFYCGWLPASPGKFIQKHKLRTRLVAKPSATLRAAVTINGQPLPAGTIVSIDGKVSSNRVWISPKMRGPKQLGKVLVNQKDLDLNAPYVEILHGKKIEQILPQAVFIQDVWLPLDYLEFFDEKKRGISRQGLAAGMQVGYIRVPEWLAKQKALIAQGATTS